jgi:ankyrin repeat protein
MDFDMLQRDVFDQDNAEFLQHLIDDGKIDIEYCDSVHGTILCAAAARYCVNTIQVLLDANADVNAVDTHGKTPLHCAISAMYNPIFSRDNHSPSAAEETVDLLLMREPDLKKKDNTGDTPLRMAARLNSPFTFKLLMDTVVYPDDADEMHYLIENGLVDKDFIDPYYGTVLGAAASLYSNGTALVLLFAGAAVNSVDSRGRTPLHHAIGNTHDKNVRDEPEDMADFYKRHRVYEKEHAMVYLLLYYGADLSVQDVYGDTPLHVAVRVDNEYMLKILIRLGAWRYLKTKNVDGYTAQDVAFPDNQCNFEMDRVRARYDLYVRSIDVFSHRNRNMPSDLIEKLVPRPAMFNPLGERKTLRQIFETLFECGAIEEIDGIVRRILYLDDMTYKSALGRRTGRAKLIRML